MVCFNLKERTISVPNSKNINSSKVTAKPHELPNRVVGQTKISQLLKYWPNGTVAVQSWLNRQGVSRHLAVRYIKGKWFTKIGKGAYIKEGNAVDWTGGVYSLQSQLGFKVHVAGLTALELLGYGHFVLMGEGNPKWLSKHKSDKRPIPVWFREYFKKDNTICIEQGLFDGEWGKALVEHTLSDCKIMVANPERAILEYLHFDSHGTSVAHGLLLMENLSTLRPKVIQELLESCQSVKVKRLFLVLAEHVNHPWVKRLNVEKIDLGKGKRVVGEGGYYNPKYQLSLPVNLKEVNQT
jgi:hypothetical protein